MNNYIEAGFPCMQVPSMHGSLRISGQLQTAVPVSDVAQNVELYLHLHFPVGSYYYHFYTRQRANIPDSPVKYRTPSDRSRRRVAERHAARNICMETDC